MKKVFYSTCVSFLFIVFLFGLSAMLTFLTFLTPQPIYDQKPIEAVIQVEGYSITRREENRNLTFYLEEQKEISMAKVIVLSYSIYDMEKNPFVFIVETPQNYIHATVNQGGFASGIVVEKS